MTYHRIQRKWLSNSKRLALSDHYCFDNFDDNELIQFHSLGTAFYEARAKSLYV